jgi:hypothetical protein
MGLHSIQGLVLFICCLGGFQAWAYSGLYTYEITCGEKTGKQVMTVMEGAGLTQVVFINEAQEQQTTEFNAKMEMQKVDYYTAGGALDQTVSYDYRLLRVTVMNKFGQRMYPFSKPVFDNNGALFYLFSQRYPKDHEIMEFKLLQSREGRIVDMNLKRLNDETLTWAGKTVRTKVFEMGLSGIARWFWPYTYKYFYRAEDDVFFAMRV